MRLSQLKELVKEVLQELEEANTTGNAGGSYLTPHAFSRNNSDNRATKQAKSIGYTKVKKKKRPYSTKLIDYLK